MIDAFIRFCFSGSLFYLYYKMNYLIQLRVLANKLFVLEKAITSSVPPKIMGPSSYKDIINPFFFQFTAFKRKNARANTCINLKLVIIILYNSSIFDEGVPCRIYS